MARSACAVMVNDGLTPRFAETAAPSATCRVGYPCTRWYGSSTPVAAVGPMGQPPRKCAVIGMLARSPSVPPATPPISSASSWAARWPDGIHVGFGSPWPCLLVSRRWRAGTGTPSRRGASEVVSELSAACITSAMTVRSLHRYGAKARSVASGDRRASRAKAPSTDAHRRQVGAPGASAVCSSAIALEPLPYRTGSTCVVSSVKKDDVMATPRVRSRAGSTRGELAPSSASEFVRVSSPSRGETSGSRPSALIRCSSVCVPCVPAASTTWSASQVVRRRRPGRPGPVDRERTAHPPPVAGTTSVTVVIGTTSAPACSARCR